METKTKTNEKKTYPCQRCGGTGIIDIYHYVLGGTCFKCQGDGRQSRKPSVRKEKTQAEKDQQVETDRRRTSLVQRIHEACLVLYWDNEQVVRSPLHYSGYVALELYCKDRGLSGNNLCDVAAKPLGL